MVAVASMICTVTIVVAIPDAPVTPAAAEIAPASAKASEAAAPVAKTTEHAAKACTYSHTEAVPKPAAMVSAATAVVNYGCCVDVNYVVSW